MIKSACLIPYCPLPLNTGARAVFNKHLSTLKSLGDCRILSRRSRPVGFGWHPDHVKTISGRGFTLNLAGRGLLLPPSQIYGILYAGLCKAFRADRAFGHSNPYHRYAFDPQWIYTQSRETDLCEIHYSYWARIPTACPKIVVVHDLWSEMMWEGSGRETKELQTADLVVTVSDSDRMKLESRGLKNILWSPPVVKKEVYEDSAQAVIVGSENKFNREGLRWLMKELSAKPELKVNVYGSLAGNLKAHPAIVPHPHYKEATDPYRENGIVLITTAHGTGIQIKAVEALACGRAVIARRGAMRGLPQKNKGWLEVDDPHQMIEKLVDLTRDAQARKELAIRAGEYYDTYLDSGHVQETLKKRYLDLI